MVTTGTYKQRPGAKLPPAPTVPRTLARSIAQEILSGRMKPDSRISAGSLCEFYGVARSTAQSALEILNHKGLTTTRMRYGTWVNHWDKWNLLDPELLAWAPADSWLADKAREMFDLLNWADLAEAGPMFTQLHRSLLPCVEARS